MTLSFQSFLVASQVSSSFWKRAMGRYQCVVDLTTGTVPLIVLLGLMRLMGSSQLPHFSHWSPLAEVLPQCGQVPWT